MGLNGAAVSCATLVMLTIIAAAPARTQETNSNGITEPSIATSVLMRNKARAFVGSV